MTREEALAKMPAGYCGNVALYIDVLRGNNKICRNMIKAHKRVEFHKAIIKSNTLTLRALRKS